MVNSNFLKLIFVFLISLKDQACRRLGQGSLRLPSYLSLTKEGKTSYPSFNFEYLGVVLIDIVYEKHDSCLFKVLDL